MFGKSWSCCMLWIWLKWKDQMVSFAVGQHCSGYNIISVKHMGIQNANLTPSQTRRRRHHAHKRLMYLHTSYTKLMPSVKWNNLHYAHNDMRVTHAAGRSVMIQLCGGWRHTHTHTMHKISFRLCCSWAYLASYFFAVFSVFRRAAGHSRTGVDSLNGGTCEYMWSSLCSRFCLAGNVIEYNHCGKV